MTGRPGGAVDGTPGPREVDPAGDNLGAMSADSAVRGATALLAEAGVPSPRVDAVRLLAHALEVDAGEAERLVLLRSPLTPAQATRFAADVDRRRQRVPLQHITGRAPFRYLELLVGPGVFVPRPETESVAGTVIDRLTALAAVDHGGGHRSDGEDSAAMPARPGQPGRRPVVVDLCTGSGAIALAVATEVPCAEVVAVELSPEALAWAGRNLERLAKGTAGLAERVYLREGDATAPAVTGDLDGTVDVVVSNPPYVPTDAVPKEPEVARHDPAMALYGLGDDGLRVPRAIAARAAELLRPGGLFVMEHADVQGEALVAYLTSQGVWSDPEDRLDAAGRPRYVVAWRAE